jgi:hypothetical protein
LQYHQNFYSINKRKEEKKYLLNNFTTIGINNKTEKRNKIMRNFIYCPGLVLFTVIVLTDNVRSSGFGKCPNYPSMPKYNMSRVS